MEGEKASSTVLLDFNDDCLSWIFQKLEIKDQPQLLKITGTHRQISRNYITGTYIKNMSNSRELYLPGFSLRTHLRDIFKHLNITNLDVSDCDLNLPIEEHTWSKLRSLKISENLLTADFVEKLNYLRSLENLIVKYVDKQISSPDWIDLFESLGSIIASIQMCKPKLSFVRSAFARNTHKLTALKKIRIIGPLINDLQTFAQLPALKEFHMITRHMNNVNNVVNFIDQAKNLEFFHWYFLPLPYQEQWNTEEIDFSWLLEVIRILRNKKERPKLCLNISFPNMDPTICVKIRHLVMKEQQLDTDPLLEVTFDRSSLNEFMDTVNGYCMELYLDRI